MSREGYIGLLTIINVATRYLWMFPIKNKEPPIKLINRFLQKRSIAKMKNKSVTTLPKGYLAKSKAFRKNAKDNGYTIKTNEIDHLFDNPIENVECMIRTDSGSEFTTQKMNETIEDHWYTHQTTVADLLSQNGMVERPH